MNNHIHPSFFPHLPPTGAKEVIRLYVKTANQPSFISALLKTKPSTEFLAVMHVVTTSLAIGVLLFLFLYISLCFFNYASRSSQARSHEQYPLQQNPQSASGYSSYATASPSTPGSGNQYWGGSSTSPVNGSYGGADGVGRGGSPQYSEYVKRTLSRTPRYRNAREDVANEY